MPFFPADFFEAVFEKPRRGIPRVGRKKPVLAFALDAGIVKTPIAGGYPKKYRIRAPGIEAIPAP